MMDVDICLIMDKRYHILFFVKSDIPVDRVHVFLG